MFRSAEHLYQHTKLVRHKLYSAATNTRKVIIASKAKSIAKKALPAASETWKAEKLGVMENICLLKAHHCDHFRKALLDTGNKQLVHNMETDNFWGFGRDGLGANKMGHILESVRKQIKHNPPETKTSNSTMQHTQSPQRLTPRVGTQPKALSNDTAPPPR